MDGQKFVGIYSRYHTLVTIDDGELKEIIRQLQYIEDYGEGFALGIFDEENEILYTSDHDIIGREKSDVLEQIKRSCKELGLNVLEFHAGYEILKSI